MAATSATNVFAKECILTALRALMKEKEFEEISITDITRKAGVSRMAYYRNYKSKKDIIVKSLEENAVKTDQYAIPIFESGDMKAYIECLFTGFAQMSDFYASLQRANLGDMILRYFNRCLIRFMARYTDPEPRKYEILAFSGAIYNMAITWIMEGLRETPGEMAQKYLAAMDVNLLYRVYAAREVP